MPPSRPPKPLYHAIPQALANESHQVIHSNDDLDSSEEADSQGIILTMADPAQPLPVAIDTQIRWIYFVLGCSVLLPWNVMITATPFFLSRLEGSPYTSTFSSYLSTSFTASRFIFLARATAVSKRTSPSRQIRACIFWLSALTLLLTISTFYHVEPSLFFAFILVNGAVQAALDSHLQTSVVAVASLFGPHAVQALMSGQAAVATVVSAVQVLNTSLFLRTAMTTTPESASATAVDGSAEEGSARVFFALSTIFLVMSAVARNMLVAKTSYKTLAAPLEQASAREEANMEEQQPLMFLGGREYIDDKARILRVAITNITLEIAVAYVFIVTMAVFPPITTSVLPTNPHTNPLLFNTIHFFVFNIGDFLGRYICAIPSLLIWSANKLLTLSLARTLFIPLFLMCNIQRPPSSVPSTPIINSDILFMLILFAFGLSNGYISSLCMMSAPSLAHNPGLKGRKDDVDVAATVANFSIAGGLAIGSVASFAVRGAICGCNPFVS